jgi:hypothetical protein
MIDDGEEGVGVDAELSGGGLHKQAGATADESKDIWH